MKRCPAFLYVPRRVAFAAFVAVALLLPAAASSAKRHLIDAKTSEGLRALFVPSSERLPLLSAHRGGAGPGLPENCMATFEATVSRGWSMLEIDLHATKDGVVVLMHDPTLDRTSNGKGPIRERTLAELKELRLKDRQGNLTEHRIPTLEEALRWARGKALLVLDKKQMPVPEVVRLITEHRAESYALLMTYGIQDIKTCHALNPGIMMEVMIGNEKRFGEFDASGVPWGNIIAFVGHTQTPDAALCKRIREKGASCMAGTSRNIDRQWLGGRVSTMAPLEADYRAVLASGVDIIETDIPRELAPLLFGGARPPAAKAEHFRLVE